MSGMKGAGLGAWLAYAAIRTVFAVMQCFPIDWNLRTARLLARAWAVVMPRHRQRAVAHLAASLGDVHPIRRISTMADRCLESVAMFAVEAICLPRLITPMSWSRYIRLVDFDETLQVLLAGRGVILVTGHYGSFEIVGHLLAALGFDVAAVMRPLDNVYLNRFIVSSRRTHGLRLLDKRGASAEAEGMLREGTLVGFIGDQDAGRKGIFVEFFGRPASTYKSIGLLAMATGSPIVVGYARRRGGAAHYDVGVQRVIHPREWESRDDPLRWITQAYTSAIEQIVRAQPEQYLWMHRRWKSQPRSSSVLRGRRAESPGSSPDGGAGVSAR